ncbi:MAG: HAMP domain-containing histidine kinase [Chryseobacterium sp.]|nr:MAG: HAMP domain-containing histidine kinase [Chryseobacterium sp.]
MESRIFHAIIVSGIFTAIINAMVLFWLNLWGFALLMLSFTLLLGFICYLSRYRNRLDIGVVIFAISANIMCAGTYYISEGSKGVNVILFALIIFILTVVTTKKQYWTWVPINLALMVVLLYIEYKFPTLLKPLYADEASRLLDMGQTMFEIIALISLITLYIKTNYIKEKRLADNRLLQLEEINETKNKLFSIVAHDLKAPLASVENYLELLNSIDLEAEDRITIEQKLLASTKRTSEMLQNILSWSKDQMNGTNVSLGPVTLHQALRKTIEVQQNLAREKGVQMVYNHDPDLKVIADPDMLQLIVRNLLNNAIKFTPVGGVITLSFEHHEDSCQIIVEDNGIGIAKENSSTLFSMKSKSTYGTNDEKGVGLGLMLTKSYVDLQDGKIWFESGNAGTTFYVSIPHCV